MEKSKVDATSELTKGRTVCESLMARRSAAVRSHCSDLRAQRQTSCTDANAAINITRLSKLDERDPSGEETLGVGLEDLDELRDRLVVAELGARELGFDESFGGAVDKDTSSLNACEKVGSSQIETLSDRACRCSQSET